MKTKKGEMLNLAITTAVNAHAGQYDRGGNPYILHCLKVMHYLKSDDEELQCIAVLHDVVEDTDITLARLIELGFSDRVVRGVDLLTKTEGLDYEVYKMRVKSTLDTMLVKKSDLRHNSDIRRLKSKTVTEKDIQRMVKYHQFYLEIQEKLAQMS
jgi:(p)ppGpp synthase/HD superfamily hydrolase